MTDYRALTQGGCIAGSQSCDGEVHWTAPAQVTRIFFQYDQYFKVTPGTTYKFAGASGVEMGKYVPSAYYNVSGCSVRISMSGRANVFYWSNEINTHGYINDLDSVSFGDQYYSDGDGGGGGQG